MFHHANLTFLYCCIRFKYGNICTMKEFFAIPSDHVKYAEATRHYNISMGETKRMSDLVECMHNISSGHLSSGNIVYTLDFAEFDNTNSSIFVDDIELNKTINDISKENFFSSNFIINRLDLIAE